MRTKKLLAIVLTLLLLLSNIGLNAIAQDLGEGEPATTVESAMELKTDEPAADEPAADEPAADEPAADEPAADESKETVTYTVTFFDVDGQVIDARDVEEGTVLELSVFPVVEEGAEWFLADEDGDIAGEEPVSADLTIEEDTYLVAVVPAPQAVVFSSYDFPGGSPKTSVNHIDIACQGLKATVGGETVSFNFTVADVKDEKVKVTVNGVSCNASGESTDKYRNPQVRISGTFPVGTKNDPEWYTITLTTKLTNKAGLTANVTLSIKTNYWSNDNVCPGLDKNYQTSGVVSGNSGIDIELSATDTTYTQFNIKKVLEGITFAKDKTFTFNIITGDKVVRTESVKIDAKMTEATVMVTGLPEGTYTVEEVMNGTAVDGYTLNTTYSENSVEVEYGTPSSVTVTNTYTPSTIDISGTKTWVDADNQDGKRPTSITVNLLADDVKVESQEVKANEAGEWKYAFTGKAKYNDDGKEIKYTVTEERVPDYSSEVKGYDITNTHVVETTDISGKKIWDDANNQDGKRPTSITVKLLADGVEVDSQKVEANEAGEWKYTFENVPVYAEGEVGRKIVYAVKEETVAGYSATYAKEGYDITNTHAPETVTISGTKTWNDADNQDGKRPTSITVNLLADDDKIESQIVKPDGNGEWKYTFEDVPVYAEGKVGRKIVYTVEEETVAGYSATYAKEGYDITNTHAPETVTISGTKTWNDANNQDDKRPTIITVKLLADGKEVSSKIVSSNGTNEWNYSFTDMPKYKAGEEIRYSVAEETVDGYTTEYPVGSYNIVNSYTPGKTSVTVTKIWDDGDNRDGKRPESIVVNLLANGDKKDSAKLVADENGVWKHTFKDLPEYSNGKKIVYTVEEERVEGYDDVEIERVEGTNDFVITNTHTPETFSLTITKEWADYNDVLGIRPERVTVYLIANGQEARKLTLSEKKNKWQITVDGLFVYADGQEIEYAIEEADVDGYEAVYEESEDGVVITNMLVDDTIFISGKKTWDDKDDKDGIRPESIVIRLLADGDEINSATVTADEDGEWSWDFGELPLVNEDGKLITYTITEDEVEGYTAEINGFDVTNVHVVEEEEKEEEEEEEEEEEDEVPKTGDNRSDMQRVLLFAGIALMMIGLISGVSLKKRMNH